MHFKKNKIGIFFTIILFLVSTVGIVFAINTISTGYRITNTSVDIYRDYCRKVRTTSGNNVFAPTKTLSEWNTFVNNKPANVNISDCTWNNNAQYVYLNIIKPYFNSVYGGDMGVAADTIGADFTTIDAVCEYAGDYLGYDFKWGEYGSNPGDTTWSSCNNNSNIVWNGSNFVPENGCLNGNRKFNNGFTTNQVSCYTSNPTSCGSDSHGTLKPDPCPSSFCNTISVQIKECRNGSWVHNGRMKICPGTPQSCGN